MTLQECLERVKERKPNAYSDEALCEWLNECEAQVQRELMNVMPENVTTYVLPDDNDKSLILPKPYDNIYATYIIMMIQYVQEEYSAYNNSTTMFASQWAEAQKYYNDKHKTPPVMLKNWMA